MAKAVRAASPVTIELSAEEAQALFDITGRVGGPSDHRRGLIDNIRNALVRAGFDDNHRATDVTGSMDFE